MDQQVFSNLKKWKSMIDCALMEDINHHERLIQRATWDIQMAYKKGLINKSQAEELNSSMNLGLVF